MYAGFVLRCKAFFLDYLLILGYLLLLMAVNMFLFPSLQKLFTGSPAAAQTAGFLMVTLPVSLYFIISDSAAGGQSFGKRISGIKVVNQQLKAISIPHSILRTILKFSPWELSHFLVYRLVYFGDGEVAFFYFVIGGAIYILIFLYILSVIFTKRKQSFYDLIANSFVIKVN